MKGPDVRRFLRGLFIFLLGGALCTVFGVAVGFFVFPYVFPPPEASEQLLDADRSPLVANGPFIHANSTSSTGRSPSTIFP